MIINSLGAVVKYSLSSPMPEICMVSPHAGQHGCSVNPILSTRMGASGYLSLSFFVVSARGFGVLGGSPSGVDGVAAVGSDFDFSELFPNNFFLNLNKMP